MQNETLHYFCCPYIDKLSTKLDKIIKKNFALTWSQRKMINISQYRNINCPILKLNIIAKYMRRLNYPAVDNISHINYYMILWKIISFHLNIQLLSQKHITLRYGSIFNSVYRLQRRVADWVMIRQSYVPVYSIPIRILTYQMDEVSIHNIMCFYVNHLVK